MQWRGPAALGALVAGLLLSDWPRWAAVVIALLFAWVLQRASRQRRRSGLVLVCFVASGYASGELSRPRPLPQDAVERFAEQTVEGWGQVREFPIEREWGTQVVVDLTAARLPGEPWQPVRLGIRLLFEEAYPALGERIHFKAKVKRFRRLGIPGEYDQVSREHGRGVYLRGYLSNADWRLVGEAPATERILGNVRKRIVTEAFERMGPRAAGVFAGLAVGERTRMPMDLQDAWRTAGVTHLVAISGMHLAIVYLFLRVLVRQLFRLWPTLLLYIDGAWWSSILALPGVAAYAVIAGAQAPTKRALAMLVVVVAAQALQRRARGFGPLGWGSLGLLALEPGLLRAPGFQLSFAAVFGAIAWARKREHRLPDGVRARAVRYLAAATAGSFVAMVWTMPLSAHHFGQASIIGLVANLPLIPFVSLLLTPACFVYGCLVAIMPGGPWPWALLEAGLRLANATAEWFAAIPGAAVDMRLDVWETTAAVGMLGLLTAYNAAGPRRRRWTVLAAGLLLCVGVAYEYQRGRAWQHDLRIDVLSVGQGDAVMVGSAGRHMLVDTGGGQPAFYRRVLRPYLVAERIGSLDLLVLTHPHEDHVGAAAELIADMRPRRIVVPDRSLFGALRPEILAAARKAGLPVDEWRAGRSETWARARIDVLHPTREFAADKLNDISLVMRLSTDAGNCALLMGDAEHAAEAALPTGQIEACGLLKAAHHGSRTSSSPGFLATVRPQIALVSAGFGNQFRHPHIETLRALGAAGVRVVSTSEAGTLSARASGNRWELHTFMEEPSAWSGWTDLPLADIPPER